MTPSLSRTQSIVILGFLGFASGIPLTLVGSTLIAWFAESHLDLRSIGLLTLLSQPYIYKILWAPLLDSFPLPFLGKRRGWILLTQVLLILTLAGLAFSGPEHIQRTIIFGILSAFCAATQDIASSAYLTETPSEKEKGLAAGAYNIGYRVAMLVTGGVGLVLAGTIGWKLTYLIMAGLMVIGILTVFFAPEPLHHKAPPQTFYNVLILPFADFFKRFNLKVFLLFVLAIIFYKFGDALSMSLSNVFYLRYLKFSLVEVGILNKGLGLAALFVGSILAGILLTRLALIHALVLFGALQACTLFIFVWLAHAGHSYAGLIAAISSENFFLGMSSTAFMVFLMRLCNKDFAGTQYTLLSVFATMGTVYVGPLAAYLISHVGWAWFYFIAFCLCLPGLALIYGCKRFVSENKN